MQYHAGNSSMFLTILCISLLTAFLTDFLVIRHSLKNQSDTNLRMERDADGNKQPKEKHLFGLGIISGLVAFIVLSTPFLDAIQWILTLSYVPPIVAVSFAGSSFLGGWIASKSVPRTVEWKLELDESMNE
jgi:hypothetical protein